jgi:hypothetical protein
MKRTRFLLIALVAACLLLPVNLMAIQLIFKDYRGHYHYRCTEKTGGITTVIYRAEGIYVDGPEGQKFFPMETASIVRSGDNYVRTTEKFARWGCREKLNN